MDRVDAVEAAELVGATTVIPCHYNTFPPIETDAQAFKSDVESRHRLERRRARARARRTRRDPRDRPDPGRPLGAGHAGGELADIEGVAEAYSVTGEWDFVAILRAARARSLAPVVTGRDLASSPGITPHPDDGRVRGLLPPRPRGAVLARAVRASAPGGGGGRLTAAQTCSAEMHRGERLRIGARPRPRRVPRAALRADRARREVAHLGCADSPYTAELLAAGSLLHARLVRGARVTGFDVDAPAVELRGASCRTSASWSGTSLRCRR